MKILNISFVCRIDGVEVHESVCPARDSLCTVSIPDMKMADELIDLLYRMELSAWLWDSVHKILPFPVPAAEPVKELKCWVLCCLLLPVLFPSLNSWKGYLMFLIEPWQGWQLHRAGGSKLSHLFGQCLTVLGASGWVSTAGSPRI